MFIFLKQFDMKYIYVFDYQIGNIYEISLSNKDFSEIQDNIELYLYTNYNLKSSMINYMISNVKLDIEQISPIK